MQEEVHVDKAKEEPVVETILEEVHERHGVIRESVNEQSLKFSLHVVSNHHCKAKFLIKDEL